MQTVENKNLKDNNEWICFLNGKIFYLAASHSLKDTESGKVFFETILETATPKAIQPIEIPQHPLQFEESQIH